MLVTYMVHVFNNYPVMLFINFVFTPYLGYACTHQQTDKYLQNKNIHQLLAKEYNYLLVLHVVF